MFLSIDVHSDVAIYSQIVRQVKFAVAAGTLSPGQLLPSARTLARKLAINPNTVARAFTDLQNDGVVETLRGRGMVIRDDAVAICRREREEVLGERLGEALAESWHAGLNAKKIQSIVDKHLKQLTKTNPTVMVRIDDDTDDKTRAKEKA
ncbi:HTH-type transcriptional repressor YtrA [Novipirellula aureliae]|uniref:HTH-type transcriptional repressor YtrA n=1 Tax=Novipirellula aureliae TaxID=2527966 RepID=A0A5C6E217_9BACT|nr:GntR family transcriptional regulator [Novipirellula aureliae]TWU42962.1 HTH-type transcriptional repressor YtrA [Novipirellula aureliae]